MKMKLPHFDSSSVLIYEVKVQNIYTQNDGVMPKMITRGHYKGEIQK